MRRFGIFVALFLGLFLALPATVPNNASLVTAPFFYEVNAAGQPLAGGKLYTYQAGGNIPLATYTDATLTTPNPNPVILDAYGKAQIWFGSQAYKLDLFDANNLEQPDYPIDNILINSVASLASTSAGLGDALITVQSTMTGGQSRTQHSKNADIVNINDFVASTDGGDYGLAFNRCLAGLTRSTRIECPSGSFNVATAITLPSVSFFVSIAGKGQNETQFNWVGTTANAMFTGPVSVFTATFENFGIYDTGKLAYGIQIPFGVRCKFLNVTVSGTGSSASSYGIQIQQGYSNVLRDCDIFSNAAGGGISLGSAVANLQDISVDRCRVYENPGIGILIQGYQTGGRSVRVTGCDLEGNGDSGIFAYGVGCLMLRGNYLERNGYTGHTYTTPAATIHAEIHLVSDPATLSASSTEGCEAACVEDSTFTSYTNAGSHYSATPLDGCIFTNIASRMEVRRNSILNATGYNGMVAIPADRTISAVAESLVVKNNTNNVINVYGSPTAANFGSFGHLVETNANLAKTNYAIKVAGSYVLTSGSGGAAPSTSGGTFKNSPIWNLGGAGSGAVYAAPLTLASFPELESQWCWFGCWWQVTGSPSSAGIKLTAAGTVQTTTPGTVNAPQGWQFVSILFQMPASGSPYFGFEQLGSGTVQIAEPTLTLLGDSINGMPSTL